MSIFITTTSVFVSDQLLLEPDEHPAARAYQAALGVTFVQPPTPMGPVTTAILDDTCGNLIQLAQMS